MPPASRHARRPSLEALEGRALLAAAGSLDPSFGAGGGFVQLPLGYGPIASNLNSATANQVAVVAGGQVLLDGTTSEQVPQGGQLQDVTATTLTEFNADGSLNTAFGVGGHVPLGANYAISVQSTGEILEYGAGQDAAGNPSFEVIGITPGGKLDTTFGVNGVATYPSGTATPQAGRVTAPVAAVPIGSQLVLVDGAGNSVRLNANGSIDASYGQAGTSNPNVSIPGTHGTAVVGAAVQGDGEVVAVANVVTGFYQSHAGPMPLYEVVAFRVTAAGELDPSFGSSGLRVLVPPAVSSTMMGTFTASSVVADPVSGDVVFSGLENDQPMLDAIGSTGALDPNFGTKGVVIPGFSGKLAVEPSGGDLVLASGYFVARYSPAGTPDASFGTILTPGVAGVNSKIAYPTTVATSPDGSIVVAGQGGPLPPAPAQIGFGLARLLGTATSAPPANTLPTANPASVGGSKLTAPALYATATGTFEYDYTDGPEAGGVANITDQLGIGGANQSIPAAADYLGAGQDQFAVYLSQSGTYAIQTGIGAGYALQFGTPGAGQTIPAPADYEGTGKADLAVYLTASGTYAILPSDGSPGRQVQFGPAGQGASVPVPADYYGTGRADLAVYITATGSFAIQDPTGKTPGRLAQFGMPGVGHSIPVPGDYDGSGKTELAVYVPSLGAFFYRSAISGKDVEVPFGTAGAGDVPVVGDFDGAGHDEFAIYDPTRGFFAYRSPVSNTDVIISAVSEPGGSIAVGEPAGGLAVFQGPTDNPGARTFGFVSGSASSGTATAQAANVKAGVVRATTSQAVPSGPASARPRAPVNQGGTDSLKIMD